MPYCGHIIDNVRRYKLRELPYKLCKVLRYTLENGKLSLWLDLGNGEQGLFVTSNQRVYDIVVRGQRFGALPLYARHGGGHRVTFVWGSSDDEDEIDEQQADDEAVERIKAEPTTAVSRLMDEIMTEMARVWGDHFEGTIEDYEWLLANYGITEDEDVEWINICEYYGEGISPDDEPSEDWLQTLRGEQAVRTILEQLLQKYRSNTARRHS
jgi:hypothetical protein